MKINFWIYLIIAVLSFSSCKSTEPIIEDNEDKVDVALDKDTINHRRITTVSDSDSLFASISRTPCFGQCPVYTLKIYASGYMEYEGKNFMTRIGTYNAYLSEEKMLVFIDTALSIDFMNLADSYDSPISDLPSTITSIVIDGHRKEVMRRHRYPRSIIHLEQLFDVLVATEEWKLTEGSDSNER